MKLECHLSFLFALFLLLAFSGNCHGALQKFDSTAPLNYPSWFIVPQQLAGYPLYLPQEPIFVAGSSSDYVNGWGDYRYNNFYDQGTGGDEPEKDQFYNRFADVMAGRYTVPTPDPRFTTTPTTTPVPAEGDPNAVVEGEAPPPEEPAPAAAEVPADAAATERSVRQFVAPSNKTGFAGVLFGRGQIRTATRRPGKVWNIPDLLEELAIQLSKQGKPVGSEKSALNQVASVLAPALDRLETAEESGTNGTRGVVIPPKINRELHTPLSQTDASTEASPTARPTVAPFMVQPIPSPAAISSVVTTTIPTPIVAPNETQVSPKVMEDLFQLAFAWPPLSMQRTMIALPGPASPRPIDVYNHVVRTTTLSPNSTTFGKDGRSIGNPVLEVLFQQLMKQNGKNETFDISYATNASDGSLLHQQKILLPAYLADFAMVPLASKRRSANFSEPVRNIANNETLDNRVIVLPVSESLMNSSNSNTTAEKRAFNATIEAVAVTDDPVKTVMKNLGSCSVTMANKQLKFGVCVVNSALISVCDGMGMKRSDLCGPDMSCCFPIS